MAKSLLWKLSHDRSAMMVCQQLITVWSGIGRFLVAALVEEGLLLMTWVVDQLNSWPLLMAHLTRA